MNEPLILALSVSLFTGILAFCLNGRLSAQRGMLEIHWEAIQAVQKRLRSLEFPAQSSGETNEKR